MNEQELPLSMSAWWRLPEMELNSKDLQSHGQKINVRMLLDSPRDTCPALLCGVGIIRFGLTRGGRFPDDFGSTICGPLLLFLWLYVFKSLLRLHKFNQRLNIWLCGSIS